MSLTLNGLGYDQTRLRLNLKRLAYRPIWISIIIKFTLDITKED